MPKVSVIIPTYNLSGTLVSTIKSVLDQTMGDLQVLVVDDGSSDGTQQAVEAIDDRRVRYFFKENGGVSSARNYGLARAEGQYIAFLDHDDLWPADFLEVMVGRLEEKPA
ncbi:MAG: glycosyltransferase family 2 protein, partial [Anaerohalosphaera sp.]|nr:glycosyltransferase family 2 protein [Anaerohalosphaera sp.]